MLKVWQHVRNGEILTKACESDIIFFKQYISWSKKMQEFAIIKDQKAKALDLCSVPLLNPIMRLVVQKIFKHNEQGMNVHMQTVFHQVELLFVKFREK